MTDSIEAQTRRPPDPPRVTGQLGRGRLEQALNKALDGGPASLAQQVRYILAISQMTSARPVEAVYPQHPLGVAESRMTALADIADTLTEPQVKSLVREARQIEDLAVRLPLLAVLALHLQPRAYRALVTEIWEQAQNIANPASRSEVLFKLAPLLTRLTDEPGSESPLMTVVAAAQAISNTEARMRSLLALAPHVPRPLSLRLYHHILDEIDASTNDTLRCNTLVAMVDRIPEGLKSRALNSAQAIENPADRARTLTALAQIMPTDLQPRLRTEALQAISTIASEEARAEALCAFAPHLEYARDRDSFPVLLERALQIAVAMTRRHIRARVLVALAPHLTLDLQGEALAAVHSLSSERERAMLLAELAPTLPPEMLVASLAVAHTMREQDARVHALTVLANYVPDHTRDQTLLDALAAAANLPHHFERVTALMALVDILPPQLQEQAFTNALETTRLIDNENARARALNLLGSHLPAKLLHRALETSREIEDNQQRLTALSGIVSYLPEKAQRKVQQEMLECIHEMPFEYKRARALVSVASLMPLDMLPEVHQMADAMEDAFDRVSVYITLTQNLPPEQRPDIIAKAWSQIKYIEDGYDRASALASIAPFLPKGAHTDLGQAVSIVVGAIVDEYDQASAISILAPLLANSANRSTLKVPDYYAAVEEGLETALDIEHQQLRTRRLEEGARLWTDEVDPDRTYAVWRKIAARLKSLPLADVLLCLGALKPMIQQMTDQDGMNAIARILGVR